MPYQQLNISIAIQGFDYQFYTMERSIANIVICTIFFINYSSNLKNLCYEENTAYYGNNLIYAQWKFSTQKGIKIDNLAKAEPELVILDFPKQDALTIEPLS